MTGVSGNCLVTAASTSRPLARAICTSLSTRVEWALGQSVKRLATVGHGHDFVVLTSKHGGQKLKCQVIVLGNENPAVRTHARRLSWRSCDADVVSQEELIEQRKSQD